jgi:predicted Zn-dependent peptidase
MSPAIARLMALGVVVTLTVGAAPLPRIQFTDTKLRNGLRVIISEDHSAPVFTLAVTYNAGSRDERKGRTGFAHLFEHMMFKGSENVGALEHPHLVFAAGGIMDATTNKDRTLYFATLPSNQLDLGLFLEADRMRSLEITQANFENQRAAVKEERLLRVDNQPYGRTFEVIEDLAYENFAYEHSVIGSMQDLDAATVDDAAAFFKTYYAPNNAVLSIVGDVDTKVALEKVRKYFESIPAQPAPTAVDMTEPAQGEERRTTINDPLARLPRIDMVYKISPADAPDQDALQVLATILSSGRSSRFYENIVRQKQLSSGTVSAFPDGAKGPGLFNISATAAPGKTIADLEAAIEAEIERIKTGPIEGWEMQKARAAAKSGLVSTMASSLGRAVALGDYALFENNPDKINSRADAIAKVTADDVQKVARQYLVKTGRTVVISVPKASTPSAPSGGQR